MKLECFLEVNLVQYAMDCCPLIIQLYGRSDVNLDCQLDQSLWQLWHLRLCLCHLCPWIILDLRGRNVVMKFRPSNFWKWCSSLVVLLLLRSREDQQFQSIQGERCVPVRGSCIRIKLKWNDSLCRVLLEGERDGLLMLPSDKAHLDDPNTRALCELYAKILCFLFLKVVPILVSDTLLGGEVWGFASLMLSSYG